MAWPNQLQGTDILRASSCAALPTLVIYTLKRPEIERKFVMRSLCVLAQRNEVACLEPWVRYHTYMVGAENIHIIDNASDIPSVVEKVSEYEALGIGVTRIPPGTSLEMRGRYTADVIRNLESENHYDYIFPMDCDEFIILYDEANRPTCKRSAIESYLEGLSTQEGVFEISDGLENINKVAGKFIRRLHYKKVFFSTGQCLNLDIGFHRGFPKNNTPPILTRIAYLHMQVRPYSMFRYLAKQKLDPFVDTEDLDALRAHTGANVHLVELFLKTEDEYDAALAEKRLHEIEREEDFEEFGNFLKIIGVNPDFLNGPF